ncbi:MAG: type II secretion system protein, partial [Geminicoccaceae bacterium]
MMRPDGDSAHSRSRVRQRGFTLLEVLVALI